MSYLGTLESGIVPSSLVLKNHHLILTASVFSQQVLCPSKKCEEKHQPQKMHPQVTFWEASTPKILTETIKIGQLQRCNERLYSFMRLFSNQILRCKLKIAYSIKTCFPILHEIYSSRTNIASHCIFAVDLFL